MNQQPVQVLIVEDNEGDVDLTLTALRDTEIAIEIHVVGDGEQASAFLMREGIYASVPRPDLILLDLNLPNKNGFQLLTEIKADHDLKAIPVIVFSGSDQESDIAQAYDLQVAAYLVKPGSLNEYLSAMRAIKELWFHRAARPTRGRGTTA